MVGDGGAGPARNTGHVLEGEGGDRDKRVTHVHRKVVYLERRKKLKPSK